MPFAGVTAPERKKIRAAPPMAAAAIISASAAVAIRSVRRFRSRRR
jgi:hypothetical protein